MVPPVSAYLENLGAATDTISIERIIKHDRAHTAADARRVGQQTRTLALEGDHQIGLAAALFDAVGIEFVDGAHPRLCLIR